MLDKNGLFPSKSSLQDNVNDSTPHNRHLDIIKLLGNTMHIPLY